MAILLNGMDRAEISRWTAAMIASGERMDFSSLRRPDGGLKATTRQALHRRRGGQDHPAAGAAGGRLRRRRPAALRPRPGPHRRHPGQAGVHPRLAGGPEQRRDAGPAAGRGCRDLRRRRRPGPGRQEALRAARRHRHGGGHPADRLLDHEQEDRRGHRLAGAGRQGGQRRVHEGRGPGPRAGRDHGGPGQGRRRATRWHCSPT